MVGITLLVGGGGAKGHERWDNDVAPLPLSLLSDEEHLGVPVEPLRRKEELIRSSGIRLIGVAGMDGLVSLGTRERVDQTVPDELYGLLLVASHRSN